MTKLVFATAVQCINHKRTQQYQRGLAASDLQQDEDVLVELEKQARAEKDRCSIRQWMVAAGWGSQAVQWCWSRGLVWHWLRQYLS